MNCFIDLDGVLADLHTPMYRQLGITPYERMPYRLSEFGVNEESYFNTLGTDFWANLDLLPFADAIVDRCDQLGPTRLLSYAVTPMAAAGKMIWSRKNYPRHKLMLAEEKALLARGNLLVDDS